MISDMLTYNYKNTQFSNIKAAYRFVPVPLCRLLSTPTTPSATSITSRSSCREVAC